MQLQHIPLERIKISKLNMRHSRKHPDVSDILPSIRERGLRQPILVRKEGKGFGVVAGRRRWFALKTIAKETGSVIKVPCAIMEAGDDAAALEATIIENVGRLPVSEMEQYEAFQRLSEQGRSVDEIAGYFGVTELMVKRILALANLLDKIKALYSAGELQRNTIRALTLATSEQQAEWLALYNNKDDHAPQGRSLKVWLGGGAAITVDAALFVLETYDGAILEDLFGECGQFEDAALFWEHQSKAIAARIEAYKEDGWRDVILLERGAYFHQWDYVKRPRTKGGKVFVATRHDGRAEFHEGFITSAEARRLDKSASGADDRPAEIKPEMSGPMAEYILRHRHGAARASLLSHPGIGLRLAVAHLLAGSALWQVRAHDPHTRKAETSASLEAAPATDVMDAERTAIAETLKEAGYHYDGFRPNGDDYRLCEIFAALLKLDDTQVIRILTYAMAETLEVGTAAVEATLHVTHCDLSDWWNPDEAFFTLLRDKRAINAMVADIAGETCAKSVLTETAKVQKQVIGNRINGEGCEANPDWLPDWMQTPPTRLVEDAASPPADAWARVEGLFEQKPAE